MLCLVTNAYSISIKAFCPKVFYNFLNSNVIYQKMENKQKKEQTVNLRSETETWLLKNAALINKSGIDRRARIPEGTIQKFIKHKQKINDKRIKSIHRIILNLCIKRII